MDLITSEWFESRTKALLSQWHVPGVAIATFDDSRVIARAFGLASIEPPIPATPETIFDCGSTSKSIAAAIVATLVADEQQHPHLTWATPVCSLLKDDFVLADPTVTASVTIEDILSHRSGMPRHDFSYMSQNASYPDTPKSITTNLRNLPLGAPLRTKFQYCNMMYTVAAHLVEHVTGQSFASSMQTKIFNPLNMHSTYVLPSSVSLAGQSHRYSKPYIYHPTTAQYTQASRAEQPEGLGAGLIQSTVLDYAKWIQAIMNKNPSLLPTEIWKDLCTPRIIEEPDPDDEDNEELPPFTSPALYALGWSINSYRGYRIVSHDGAETGYRSQMLFVPKANFGVVIFGNASGAEKVGEIIYHELIDEVLHVPAAERVDWAERAKQQAESEKADAADSLDKLRKELSGSSDGDSDSWTPQPTSIPLASYVGTYTNSGYHELTVSIKDDNLFIDATDRTMAFTMTLSHIRDDRMFIGCLDDIEEVEYVRAEFEIDDHDDAQYSTRNTAAVRKMGLQLCHEISPELIWFTRVER